MRTRVLIDGRNMLDPVPLREAGFVSRESGARSRVTCRQSSSSAVQGTRLRPLTERTRKDMLPLVDRPLLAYTFEHLRRHGVDRAVVSCGYLPDQIRDHFGDAYGSLALAYEVEDEPLGTGGGIGFAARGLGETFFALNGDSLREADLDTLLAFHRDHGGEGDRFC